MSRADGHRHAQAHGHKHTQTHGHKHTQTHGYKHAQTHGYRHTQGHGHTQAYAQAQTHGQAGHRHTDADAIVARLADRLSDDDRRRRVDDGDGELGAGGPGTLARLRLGLDCGIGEKQPVLRHAVRGAAFGSEADGFTAARAARARSSCVPAAPAADCWPA